MTDRTAARAVGIFFIIASLAGILSGVVQVPILDADDVLAEVAANEAGLATGALLELLMGLAVIGIVVSITPILRRFSERIALGFTIARTIETVFYGVSAIGSLTLLTLSREAADPATADTMKAVLLGGREWGIYTVQMIVFSLGALLLNWLLFRTKLVPKWLAGWGVAGAVLYLLVGPLVAYGLEPFSSTQVLLVAPLGVQELVFAVWLIVKGFSPVPARSAA